VIEKEREGQGCCRSVGVLQRVLKYLLQYVTFSTLANDQIEYRFYRAKPRDDDDCFYYFQK